MAQNPSWSDYFDGGMSTLNKGKTNPAALAMILQNQRVENINRGQKTVDKEFAGFNQDFYNKRAQDYINYVMPQLGEQVRGQQKAIAYGMADRGTSNSSIARNAVSGLAKQTAMQQQAIAEQGITQAQELERQVESNRADLYDQVIKASDPAGAGMRAGSAAATIRQPSTFSPFINTAASGLSAWNQGTQQQQLTNAANSYQQVYTAPSLGSSYRSQKIN